MLWTCCRALQALHALSCAAGSLDVASPSTRRLLHRSVHSAPSAKSSAPGFPLAGAQSCSSQHGDLLWRVGRGKAPLQTNYPKTQRLRGKLPLAGSSEVHRVSLAAAEIHISQLSLPSPALSLRVYCRTDGVLIHLHRFIGILGALHSGCTDNRGKIHPPHSQLHSPITIGCRGAYNGFGGGRDRIKPDHSPPSPQALHLWDRSRTRNESLGSADAHVTPQSLHCDLPGLLLPQ